MEANLYAALVEALRVLFLATIPVVLAVALAGMLVGTLQAATTIYDLSLGYAARVAAIIVVIYLFYPTVSQSLFELMNLTLR